jgi:streptogramin lyase
MFTLKFPAMRIKLIFIFIFLQAVPGMITLAHPGSGIVVDRSGQIYFTDTGKGIWKIDTKGDLVFLPASKFHWMTIDPSGYFAGSPKTFGNFFERVTGSNNKPALIMCSDFPLVVAKDGNIYYADTRKSSAKIMRRSPDGKETVLASNKIFQFVSGIAAGADGSLYITESANPNANTIRKITMKGTMNTIATFTGIRQKDPPLETTPAYCRGLAVDSTGNIYVAATGSRCVLKINPQGKLTTLLQVDSPWAPTGVAVSNGEIFILEWHDVSAENSEVRTAYLPRIRKTGRDGKVKTLASISRK